MMNLALKENYRGAGRIALDLYKYALAMEGSADPEAVALAGPIMDAAKWWEEKAAAMLARHPLPDSDHYLIEPRVARPSGERI